MSELEAQLPIEHVLVLAEGAIGPQLQVFLAEQGFTVDAIGTEAEADAKLEAEQYEVLVFDLSVIPVQGPDFVQRLLEDYPDLAIVVLADLAESTTAAICLQHGAFEYVTEPVDLHHLRLAIDRAIRRRGAQIQTQKISACSRTAHQY